jgi:nucleoside-diphosphate kinase
MKTTLVLIKPGAMQRGIAGEIINRFEKRGLILSGMKLMQLTPQILREHYAHIATKPFYPDLEATMTSCPVIALALTGLEAPTVVRRMAGVTNAREAAPGTIRGDYAMSVSQNVIHASEDDAAAEVELKRFFRPEELLPVKPLLQSALYSSDER